MGDLFTMVPNNYGLKRCAKTERNPQAITILEEIHQTIETIISNFDKDNN
jgi:hypothetical protein